MDTCCCLQGLQTGRECICSGWDSCNVHLLLDKCKDNICLGKSFADARMLPLHGWLVQQLPLHLVGFETFSIPNWWVGGKGGHRTSELFTLGHVSYDFLLIAFSFILYAALLTWFIIAITRVWISTFASFQEVANKAWEVAARSPTRSKRLPRGCRWDPRGCHPRPWQHPPLFRIFSKLLFTRLGLLQGCVFHAVICCNVRFPQLHNAG